MNQIQDKVINDLVNEINSKTLEGLLVYTYSNTGKISIQKKNIVGEIGRITFDFQYDTMSFRIYRGDYPIPSECGRVDDYFDFYMYYTNSSKYQEFKKNLKGILTNLGK
jgi:hypothetical protein